jgi:hypothetical protein
MAILSRRGRGCSPNTNDIDTTLQKPVPALLSHGLGADRHRPAMLGVQPRRGTSGDVAIHRYAVAAYDKGRKEAA